MGAGAASHPAGVRARQPGMPDDRGGQAADQRGRAGSTVRPHSSLGQELSLQVVPGRGQEHPQTRLSAANCSGVWQEGRQTRNWTRYAGALPTCLFSIVTGLQKNGSASRNCRTENPDRITSSLTIHSFSGRKQSWSPSALARGPAAAPAMGLLCRRCSRMLPLPGAPCIRVGT